MSIKFCRTFGLKASRSLKMITTGGRGGSSLDGELRFFPGVPLLDFYNTTNTVSDTHWWTFEWWHSYIQQYNNKKNIWTHVMPHSLTLVFVLYQSQSVLKEQCALLCSCALICSVSSSSSSSSSTTAPVNFSSTFFIKCFSAVVNIKYIHEWRKNDSDKSDNYTVQ